MARAIVAAVGGRLAAASGGDCLGQVAGQSGRAGDHVADGGVAESGQRGQGGFSRPGSRAGSGGHQAPDEPESARQTQPIEPEGGALVVSVSAMVGVVAGVWGLFGGFAVSGLELQALLRRRGCWPWQAREGQPPEISLTAYLAGEIIRMLVGAGLAWAAAATGQISGPLGAVGIGAAAPFILDQLSRSGLLASPAGAGLARRGQEAVPAGGGADPDITMEPISQPDPQGQT